MSLPTNEESFGQWLGLLIASEPGLWQGLESLLFYYMKDLSSNIFIISKVSNYMSICDRKPQPETSSYDLNIKMEKYGKKNVVVSFCDCSEKALPTFTQLYC